MMAWILNITAVRTASSSVDVQSKPLPQEAAQRRREPRNVPADSACCAHLPVEPIPSELMKSFDNLSRPSFLRVVSLLATVLTGLVALHGS